MQSLSTLPIEILFLISDCLERPDILTLLRCSRHFHDSLLPLIWKSLGTYDRSFHANGIAVPVRKDAENRKIKGLNIVHCVTALVKRPCLGPYALYLTMRSVESDCPGESTTDETYTELIGRLASEPYDSDDNEGSMRWHHARVATSKLIDSNLTPSDFTLIHEKVKLACSDEAEAKLWMKDLRTLRDFDAWSALLLTLVPNLLVLEMDIYPGMKYTRWIIERAAYRQFNSLPVLNELLEIKVTSCYHHTCLVAVPLLELPSIRKICCFQLSGASPNKLGPRPDSSVTELLLHFSRGMLKWIHRCKKLERLTYNSTDIEKGRKMDFTVQELYNAIFSTRHTLKYLHFYPSYMAHPKRVVPPVGRFQEFRVLKHLHIASNQLFDCIKPIIPVPDFSRLLPETLETLHVMGIWSPSFLRVLTGLANHISGSLYSTPHLKHLIVEIPFTALRETVTGFSMEYFILSLDDVETVFGQVGVKIEFTNYYNADAKFINDVRNVKAVVLRPDFVGGDEVDVLKEWLESYDRLEQSSQQDEIERIDKLHL